MSYQNTDRRAVVSHLQEMLRYIQFTSGENVTVPVDGIFASATAAAVREFQKTHGLPITGAVDKDTYDLLYQTWGEAVHAENDPLPIYLFAAERKVEKGEESDFVLLIKGLLNELTVWYDGFAPLLLTKSFDTDTERAVSELQRRNSLPPNGIVDKATWNAIVRNLNRSFPIE